MKSGTESVFITSTRKKMSVLLLVLFFNSQAQNNLYRVFRSTDYFQGTHNTSRFDTIIKVAVKTPDFRFYIHQFGGPSNMPASFSDTLNKGRQVVIWNNPDGPKDFNSNWSNTYTYDNSGRLISYGYSGCLTCAKQAYNYTLLYSANGWLERIQNTLNLHDGYTFSYNPAGDIIKFEKQIASKTVSLVELLR